MDSKSAGMRCTRGARRQRAPEMPSSTNIVFAEHVEAEDVKDVEADDQNGARSRQANPRSRVHSS